MLDDIFRHSEVVNDIMGQSDLKAALTALNPEPGYTSESIQPVVAKAKLLMKMVQSFFAISNDGDTVEEYFTRTLLAVAGNWFNLIRKLRTDAGRKELENKVYVRFSENLKTTPTDRQLFTGHGDRKISPFAAYALLAALLRICGLTGAQRKTADEITPEWSQDNVFLITSMDKRLLLVVKLVGVEPFLLSFWPGEISFFLRTVATQDLSSLKKAPLDKSVLKEFTGMHGSGGKWWITILTGLINMLGGIENFLQRTKDLRTFINAGTVLAQYWFPEYETRVLKSLSRSA
jgi:hypothetical protein